MDNNKLETIKAKLIELPAGTQGVLFLEAAYWSMDDFQRLAQLELPGVKIVLFQCRNVDSLKFVQFNGGPSVSAM